MHLYINIYHYDAYEHVASMCMHVLGDKAMHVQTI